MIEAQLSSLSRQSGPIATLRRSFLDKEESQEQKQSLWQECRHQLNEIAFSLNLGAALGYALVFYCLANLVSETPKNDAGYYFLRTAVRVNDILHVPFVELVTPEMVARKEAGHWSTIGEELTTVIPLLAATMIILLLLRLCSGTSIHRGLMSFFAGPSALFAGPAAYLCALHATPWLGQSGLTGTGPEVRLGAMWSIIGAEIVVVAVLRFLYPSRSVSVTALGFLLVVHYLFWLPLMWTSIPPWFHKLNSPQFLVVVFALSGLIWLIEMRGPTKAWNGTRARTCKWVMGGALLSVAIVFWTWFPTKPSSRKRAVTTDPITVELARGPCYGRCPSYRIVIHQNGLVEYFGDRNVGVGGRQTAQITTEQFGQIVQKLNFIDFYALEDRAFRWCFDTPSVGITVSWNGNAKRVVSDGDCTGARSGVQARFVEAAREIDGVLGSDRWVSCYGHCYPLNAR